MCLNVLACFLSRVLFTLPGYARIDNVEFYHCGQEGFTEFYDPRYALTWLNVGDITPAAPSYVRSSSFFHSFSPAIGVYGTNGLEIADNVVYHVVGAGIVMWGADNVARRNLVVLSVWPSTYNGRSEVLSFTWDGCFEVRYHSIDEKLNLYVIACTRGYHKRFWTFTGPMIHLGMVLLVLNMLIYRGFTNIC